MSIQQFCLRWNNHQPNFISMFTTLLNTGSLVDVTLAAEGKHLQAHKIVLSACSVYFQTLFTANPSRHPIVILKDVSYADLRTMVDFMYYGEVNVSQEQLPQILETAKMLKIKGLTEMPETQTINKPEGAPPVDTWEAQKRSPNNTSPTPNKKRRYRKTSTNSPAIIEQNKSLTIDRNFNGAAVENSITLSSLPPRKKEPVFEFKDNDENGAIDATIQQVLANRIKPLQKMKLVTTRVGMESMNPDYMAEEDLDRTPVTDQSLESDNSGMAQGQWPIVEYPRYGNSCAENPMAYGMPALEHMTADVGMLDLGTEVGAAHENTPPIVPKRRRTTNPQAEEKFQRALEAVRFGGIGFCKAARMFGVNNRTLWLEYKKKGSIDKQNKNLPTTSMAVAIIDRRGKTLIRQSRVRRESDSASEPALIRRASEPATAPANHPELKKHASQPPMHKQSTASSFEAVYIPIGSGSSTARTPPTTQSSVSRSDSASTSSTISVDQLSSEVANNTPRASHCPVMRTGPALSCNFCWNTFDECGRILRRKTKYHCPECRSNLCIVPCFHEYHASLHERGEPSIN